MYDTDQSCRQLAPIGKYRCQQLMAEQERQRQNFRIPELGRKEEEENGEGEEEERGIE